MGIDAYLILLGTYYLGNGPGDFSSDKDYIENLFLSLPIILILPIFTFSPSFCKMLPELLTGTPIIFLPTKAP